jgi:hypothetical protein
VDIETPAVIDDFKFQIHWSFNPVSDFEPILDENGDILEIDGSLGPLSYEHELKQYDFNKDRYYKILAIEKFDPLHQLFSQIVYIGMDYDGIHEVMRYNEDILYTRYYGESCRIFKRKSTGARCPECWSYQRRQRTKSHCDTCNGTGFIDGYYEPITTQVSFDSDPRKSDSQKEWENIYDTNRARLSNYPLVRPKDLIVNCCNAKRYVITHVETTKLPQLSPDQPTLSKCNYIISQMLTIEELNPDDNEYTIVW